MLTREEIIKRTTTLICENQLDMIQSNKFLKYHLTDYGLGFLSAIIMVLDTDDKDYFKSHLEKILGGVNYGNS